MNARPQSGGQPLAAALLALFALACGESGETLRPTEPAATPLIFSAHGLPGPWWKTGGSPKEFQRDSRACRSQSTRARERATHDALETAYRAFLDCMEGRMWQRGSPPRQPGAGAWVPAGTETHGEYFPRPLRPSLS